MAVRGQHPVGYWEVKSCKNFKAMSLCKQKINSYEEPELTFEKYSSSCYFGWESEPNLLNCYKVMSYFEFLILHLLKDMLFLKHF